MDLFISLSELLVRALPIDIFHQDINLGDPNGSELVPLLFCLYIDDQNDTLRLL